VKKPHPAHMVGPRRATGIHGFLQRRTVQGTLRQASQLQGRTAVMVSAVSIRTRRFSERRFTGAGLDTRKQGMITFSPPYSPAFSSLLWSAPNN